MLTASDRLQAAAQHYQAGHLREAGELCRQILTVDPLHADTLNLLGVVAYRTGHLDLARDQLGRAIAIAPERALYHLNLGSALLASDGLDEALASYRRALDLDPALARAHVGLGRALHRQNRPDEAVACYRTALDLDPGDAEAHGDLGNVLVEQGRLAAAEACYRQAIALQPGNATSHYNHVAVLYRQGRKEDATACYRRVAALKPEDEAALLNLAVLLNELGEWADEAAVYRKARALNPDRAATHYALGVAYMRLEQPAKAVPCLRAALRRGPDAEIEVNLGVMLLRLGQPEKAAERFRTAIRLQPELAAAHNNLGIALLKTGVMPEGWAEYEWRWEVEPGQQTRRKFPQPHWTGQPAQGCTLLIHAEQGFGDTLQFCRYAAMAQARGLRVIMEVPAELVRLLRSLHGASTIVARGDPLPRFDLHCPMLSLPLAMGTTVTTIPGTTPYLAADAAEAAGWRVRLAATTPPGLRVGLAWAGALRSQWAFLVAIDRQRSMPPERLAPLFAVPGVTFFSLQKGGVVPAGFPLIDHTRELRDFGGTAALIAGLDLVISVDTAIAHLAGALGKPVWLLDRFDHCWRWLAGRQDSPWYPGTRIFRQCRDGDWDAVVAAVVDALSGAAKQGQP